MSKLKITLIKSTVSRNNKQKKNAESLGLRKLNSSVVKEDAPDIRGKIYKIEHLISVEEVDV